MPVRLPEAVECALSVATLRSPKTSAVPGLPTVTAPARLLPAALVTSLTVAMEGAISVVTTASALMATPAAAVMFVLAAPEPVPATLPVSAGRAVTTRRFAAAAMPLPAAPVLKFVIAGPVASQQMVRA